jgi:hypothetical protein
MILQAEDKNRTTVEALIYVLLILSAVASIGRAAFQPVIVPARFAANNSPIVQRV